MGAIALDPGTANLVMAWHDPDGGVSTARLRNVFLEVPKDDFSKKMLATMEVPEFEIDGKLYLAGNDAFELAQTFGKELRRPMKSGVISPGESNAIPMISKMIERLVKESGAKPGTVCAYSAPADPVDADFDAQFHRSVIEGILKSFQLVPKKVTEGHAIVLSELSKEKFTGVGISWGGGMVNFCVAYRSVPVITASSARSGDWIDEKAAQACGETKPRMSAIKESADFDLTGTNLTREQAALVSYYESAIEYTLKNLKERLESGRDMPRFSEPISIVLAGGTSMVPGFAATFKKMYDKLGLPIPIKDIRVAESPLYTVCRGCLVCADI